MSKEVKEGKATRGKQKGYTKDVILIKDKSMDPYYVINEDRQYVLMKEGSTLAFGYFNSLANVLQAVSKLNTISKNKGKTYNLTEFINAYDNVNKSILKALNL